MNTKVLSVGGSIVAPEYPDVEFVSKFVEMIKDFLSKNPNDRLILVVGGGGPARIYQKAFREVTGTAENAGTDAADWIGIMATRLNAQFVKASFGDLCKEAVVTDPTVAKDFTGKILLAAGWKPGFSTDNDAVLLAEKFNADTVVNNGHTIQVNFQKNDGVMRFENKDFKLVQIHFHTPSEYTFNGKHFPMVGHIVHQADDGQLLVVAVMFQEGKDNPVIADIWKNAPKKANQNKAIKKVDVQKLVSDFNAYYRLEGSLTTPPCTEGVMWIIGKDPITASKKQMDTFTKIIGKNNRPVQKANGRAVLMSQ